MKTLFTGATGVLGRVAVPRLVAAGHEVDGVSRGDGDADWLRSVGATPIDLDLFDTAAVDRAVRGHEAVFHFATAIPPLSRMRRADAWAMNDRLRTEAAANLVTAATRHGVAAFVQESITFAYADGGAAWLDEDAPVAAVSPVVGSAPAAEQLVDGFTAAGGNGVSLRLGRLYGPGRASAETVAAVARRAAPVIGSGSNYVSSLHVADAGRAIVAALDVPAGRYNVSDDEPVTAAEYVSSLAALLGAPAPRRVPRWMARLATGTMFGLLTASHRVSNARFAATAQWQPEFRSVLEGWPSVVDALSTAA